MRIVTAEKTSEKSRYGQQNTEGPLGPSVTCAQCALAQLSGFLGAHSELEAVNWKWDKTN